MTFLWRLLRLMQARYEDWRAGDRLLVEHWKDAMKPEPRPKVRSINLIVSRDTRARQIA